MGSSESTPKLQAPKLQDISVKRGQDITFEADVKCEVHGTWKKNGLTLHNGGRINITEQTKELCFNLTIHKATEEDEGEYTLELSNRNGDASSSAKVEVLDYAVAWRKIENRQNDKIKTALKEFTPSNPEAQRLRFLLYGPFNAGKSSMANSVNNVFQGRITMKAHVAPGHETTSYKTYKIKDKKVGELSFVFNDIMGLKYEEEEASGVLTADIISALKGHIKDGYEFNTKSPLTGGKYYNSNPTLNEKVHCLVCVINAEKILKLEENHAIIIKMKEVRDVAKNLDIPHVVLMTHVDICCPLVNEDLDKMYFSKKIKKAMLDCSIKLGVSMTCIFPVKNYHEENCVDEKIDSLVLDALNTIVNFANDYVKEQI